jgi:hypothetical protein
MGGESSTGVMNPILTGGSNADEQNNCNCGSASVDNIWVQKGATGSMTSPTTYFDDIVHYKMRGQLAGYDE